MAKSLLGCHPAYSSWRVISIVFFVSLLGCTFLLAFCIGGRNSRGFSNFSTQATHQIFILTVITVHNRLTSLYMQHFVLWCLLGSS